ncbi:MAG: TRAP transporter small permease [Candidatus Hodarchaeota archaeon]
MKLVLWISDKIDYMVEQFCYLMLSVLVTITFAQVVCRYVFNNALSWPEELGSLLLVWLIFVGVTLVFKRKNHIVVDFLLKYLSDQYRHLIEFITIILSFILAVLFVVKGFELVKISFPTFSAALEISHSLWYLSVPVGGIIILIHLVSQFWHFFKDE